MNSEEKQIDISIIIITYNYDLYIQECIDSCILQKESMLNYEIIIVDDGSTDDTQNILTKQKSKKIKKFKIENSGIEKASNFAFKKSKGKYVVRVDADDKLENNFLKCIEKYLFQKPAFIYGNYSVIDKEGFLKKKVKLPQFNEDEILSRGDFLATGTIYKKDILDSHQFYSIKKINSGLENYELIIKILNQGHKGININKNLFFYRRHQKNLSKSKIKSIIEYGEKLFQTYKLGKYKTNQFHPYNLKL